MYLGNVNGGFLSPGLAHSAEYDRTIQNDRVPREKPVFHNFQPEVPTGRIHRTYSDPTLNPEAESRFGPPTAQMKLYISEHPLKRVKSLPPQPRYRSSSPIGNRPHQSERQNAVPVTHNYDPRRSMSRNAKHHLSRRNNYRKSMPPPIGVYRSKKDPTYARMGSFQKRNFNTIGTPREDYPLTATRQTYPNGHFRTPPLLLDGPLVAPETGLRPHDVAVEPYEDYPVYATRINTHLPATIMSYTDSTLQYSFPSVATEAVLPTRYQDYNEHNGTGWMPEPDYTRGRGRENLPIGQRGLNSAGHRSSRGSHSNKKMTGCHQFLRYATTLFTFIVFIAGAGILGLGIYLIGSDYGATQLSSVLGNDLYKIAAYFLIAAGALLVFISMCGCCGAIRESKFMLGCFIFAISVLVLALVAAAVIVFVFRQKMEGDIIHSMRDVLVDKYGVELGNHQDNRMVTDMWNWLQRELKCCGVTGSVNSTQSWKIYQHTVWYRGFETGKPYVPESCCKPDGDINICTGITPTNGPPSVGPPITADMQINENLYTVGCYDELVHYIQNHAVIIGVCSIATVVIMLFGLLFSAYLCRRIDVEEYMY